MTLVSKFKEIVEEVNGVLVEYGENNLVGRDIFSREETEEIGSLIALAYYVNSTEEYMLEALETLDQFKMRGKGNS